MKRVTWTILILLLCTILTLTACMGPADPAEESSQLLSSEAVPQTETEMTSSTVHTSDIDLDSKPAENTAAVTESTEPVTTAAEPPEPDTTVPQSEPSKAPAETEKPAPVQPTESRSQLRQLPQNRSQPLRRRPSQPQNRRTSTAGAAGSRLRRQPAALPAKRNASAPAAVPKKRGPLPRPASTAGKKRRHPAHRMGRRPARSAAPRKPFLLWATLGSIMRRKGTGRRWLPVTAVRSSVLWMNGRHMPPPAPILRIWMPMPAMSSTRFGRSTSRPRISVPGVEP